MNEGAEPPEAADEAAPPRTLGAVLGEQSYGLPTEDVLHAILPLMRAVAHLHARGRVAEIGLASVVEGADGQLALLRPEGVEPTADLEALRRIQPAPTSALKLVGEYRVTTDEAGTSVLDLDAAEADAIIDRPLFVPGLRAWELEVGHHDEIADIFLAGMVLAALAIGFDPAQRDHIARFSSNRANLFALQPRLHPVLAGLIVEMTALGRHDRATDMEALVKRLETYRDQPVGLEVERVLSASSGTNERRRGVLTHLRDRLFDLSRRNRLLYFKPSQASVNLTEASVPIVVRLEAIRQDDLCTWDGRFASALLSGKPVSLGTWLRFEDQPQLPSAFDRLIQATRRDRAEFGFSNLRLVVAFLRWHNLKEAPDERIVSPLLWLPVEVTRTKGVRDQYAVRVTDTMAEINPALSHRLRQLYGIDLPERVDLSTADVAALHADLLRQIQASEPGVQLALRTRPQIRLIHQRAVQRVQQFNRRRGGQKATVSTAVDFSYAREDYRPLGHVLFEKFVKPSPLPQRIAAGGSLRPGPAYAVPPQEGTGFAYGVDEGHRFAWEVDLTQVTIANFNHRKMSLVRDYADLIDGDLPQPVFDSVFSLEPRPLDMEPPPPVPLADDWSVVAADETQEAAVALARTGKSFIIQGPPGTGKSQTIANIIADGIARGRRILFVCEKRAALDVVYHRLGLAGLDGLACIIHDSQDDKKAFIADLKSRYESWIKTADNRGAAEQARSETISALEQVERELAALEAAAGLAADGEPGTSLRALIRRAAALAPPPEGFGPAAREALPALAAWDAARPVSERANRTARELLGVSGIAASPFARLSATLLRQERPLATLETAIEGAEAQLEALDSWIEGGSGYASGATAIGTALAAGRAAAAALDSGLASNLSLLDPASPTSAELAQMQRSLAGLEQARAAAAENARHWTSPLTAADAAAGLEQARAREGSFFRFLSGSWQQVKSSVEARYDFSAHAVRPTVTAALENLVALQEAQAALAREEAAAAERFGTHDLQALLRTRDVLAERRNKEPELRTLLSAAAAAADPAALMGREAKAAEAIAALLSALDGVIDNPAALSFDAQGELLRDLREGLDELPQFLPVLRDVHALDPAVVRLLLETPVPLAALEALVVDEAIARTERAHPEVRAFDIDRLIGLTRTAAQARARLRERNAATIRARSHAAFRENVRRSTLALSQLDTAGRAFKAAYATGRRELEHEFGKTMRYRSIRDLADDETGLVVRDLKPVWLMSPLSVSDTLPIGEGHFDLVIFDEASQIPMEEAVPAFSRSAQVIVVGDEMQLPPTSFFSAAPAEDELEIVAEEEGERIAILMDADSLLAQSARKLAATMLAWHYRSRSEALIGFSNAAFYGGRLITIPDRTRIAAGDGAGPVRSDDREGWSKGAERALGQAITVHRIADGVYEKRANAPEAAYIAGLVRALLASGSGQTIGIVAFSEAQQTEIEAALDRLAADDADFTAALEREIVREEDGQYNGLFVKNLENVQGDERDIMLLSICYAPGRDGRMAMNFGPINQRGGEKRLNVIFSRARRHMAIVSTVAPEAITNTHNDGARALRSFLSFAEAQSSGARDHAQAVLAGIDSGGGDTFASAAPPDPVRSAIAAALRARGHEVDEHVGGSSFRCDLAIAAPGGADYALGILLDHERDGAIGPRERYLFRPFILRSFGWRIIDIPVASWRVGPQAVIDRIEGELRLDSWASADAPPDAEEESAPAEAETLAAPEPEEAAGGGVALTEFRLKQGSSDKFWRVGVSDCDLIVEFGRTGTKGQRVVKAFDSEERARREAVKLTLEKTRKGYVEFG